MIQSVAFFVYPVTNLAQSRQFYEGALGLKLETNFGDQWIEYDVAGATFAITTAEMGRTPGAKGGAIAFEMHDLDAAVARLKEARIPFELDVTPTPVCRMAVIQDPDGNSIVLHKRNA